MSEQEKKSTKKKFGDRILSKRWPKKAPSGRPIVKREELTEILGLTIHFGPLPRMDEEDLRFQD